MRTKSLSPRKSGEIYGKFTPSPIGRIISVNEKGKVVKQTPANRAERRRVQKENRRYEKKTASQQQRTPTDKEGQDSRTGRKDGKEIC